MVSGGGRVGIYDVALKRRQALMGSSGPAAIVKNGKVFAIAMFACIGGLLYGYNQGVFGGVLAMPDFNARRWHQRTARSRPGLTNVDMGNYVSNPTLKGWLTSILELGAWLGTLLRYCPRRKHQLDITDILQWVYGRNFVSQIWNYRCCNCLHCWRRYSVYSCGVSFQHSSTRSPLHADIEI